MKPRPRKEPTDEPILQHRHNQSNQAATIRTGSHHQSDRAGNRASSDLSQFGVRQMMHILLYWGIITELVFILLLCRL